MIALRRAGLTLLGVIGMGAIFSSVTRLIGWHSHVIDFVAALAGVGFGVLLTRIWLTRS